MTRISQEGHERRFICAESTTSDKKVSEVIPDKITLKIAQIPSSYRRTYCRAMSGKSLRAAVNAFCLECVGWQREEIKLCTSIDCSLYPYRAYTKSSEEVETLSAAV